MMEKDVTGRRKRIYTGRMRRMLQGEGDSCHREKETETDVTGRRRQIYREKETDVTGRSRWML